MSRVLLVRLTVYAECVDIKGVKGHFEVTPESYMQALKHSAAEDAGAEGGDVDGWAAWKNIWRTNNGAAPPPPSPSPSYNRNKGSRWYTRSNWIGITVYVMWWVTDPDDDDEEQISVLSFNLHSFGSFRKLKPAFVVVTPENVSRDTTESFSFFPLEDRTSAVLTQIINSINTHGVSLSQILTAECSTAKENVLLFK